MKTKDIILLALLTAILFIQEQILSFLPNIQLTVFLIILYSKVFKTKKTIVMVLIYVILDNLFMGSMSLLYTPAMLIGWLIIPITMGTIFKNVEKPLYLGLLGVMYSFIYSFLFIIPNMILTKISFAAYMISDIPFEIMLAGSSFITIIWLYEPLKKVLEKLTLKEIE